MLFIENKEQNQQNENTCVFYQKNEHDFKLNQNEMVSSSNQTSPFKNLNRSYNNYTGGKVNIKTS